MSFDRTLRRSPLYRRPSKVGEQLTLVDLNHCPRIGFKGADTVAWFANNEVAMPKQPNQATKLGNGGLNARLSANEFFLIEYQSEQNSTIDTLRSEWSMDIPERTYLLERGDSHACFEITGDKTADCLAKICGVDLQPHKFANLDLAQTFVGKLSAMVIRLDKKAQLSYLLLADITASEYLWGVVEDAATEFNKP